MPQLRLNERVQLSHQISMAKGKVEKPEARSQGALLVAPAQFHAELSERIERGQELLSVAVQTETALRSLRDDYYTWDEFNTQLLRRRFSTDELSRQYADSAFFAAIYERTLAEKVSELRGDIGRKLRRLRSISEQISLFEVDSSVSAASRSSGEPTSPATSSQRNVFIVHGRNDASKLEVATFLEALVGERPTILHEQPNEGRTIIEKLEHYAGAVDTAVVLLTADDEGRLRRTEDQLLPRGRQNVVLELGYFIARLGRSRVILLYESDVELPSDMSGIVYLRLDAAGGWKLALARELKALGFDADLNRAV